MLKRLCVKIAVSFLLITIAVILFNHKSAIIEPPPEQWYLADDTNNKIDIGWHEMWDYYISVPANEKNTVRVAVVDTGVDVENPEINESIISTETDTTDTIGHGTKVTGIICASQYTGCVAGISDIRKTEIVPIKVVTDGETTCGVEDLTEAIKLAESLGCSICNISLNTNKDDKSLRDTIVASEMLSVVSAGNGEHRGEDIDKQPSYPASYCFDNLITVTNIKSNGRLNSTANYGQCVDIAAPGTEIYNIDIDNRYGASTGTSFATPVITGLAAMIYICDEKMTATRCKEIILSSATNEKRLKNKINSNRIVNLDAALKKALKRSNIYDCEK